MRGTLPPAVHNEHAGGSEWGGQVCGGGVGDVVRNEAHKIGIEARKRRAQKEWRPTGVERAQPLPLAGGDVVGGLSSEVRVVGVGDGVEVGGYETGVFQAPRRGLLRYLPGRKWHGLLAVLAPAEPLLLGGGDRHAVDDEGGSEIVEDGVDT